MCFYEEKDYFFQSVFFLDESLEERRERIFCAQIFFSLSLCLADIFLVVAGFLLKLPRPTRKRTTVKHFCVIYIYIRIYSAKQ